MKRALATVLAVAVTTQPMLAWAEPAPRSSAPQTRSCPNALRPPKPVTTSEAVPSGSPTPSPLRKPANEFGSCDVVAPKDFVEPLNTASAWMVFNLDTGDVIATKDPHGRYRPASVIKGLLAMVAIRELRLSDTHVATDDDAEQEGSSAGLVPKVKYTNEQLLQALFLVSGNDAAHALAEELGGQAKTIEKMQRLANELGTTDTAVKSVSGLDAPGMSTSARDIALIYASAWRNPTFAKLIANDHVDLPVGQGQSVRVDSDNGLLQVKGALGGKTGYTDDANHTFVGAKRSGKQRLGVVILDTTIDYGRAWQQADALLDAGFATKGHVGTLSLPAEEEQAAPSEGADPTPSPVTDTAVAAAEPSSTPAIAGFGVLVLFLLGAVTWRLGRTKSDEA